MQVFKVSLVEVDDQIDVFEKSDEGEMIATDCRHTLPYILGKSSVIWVDSKKGEKLYGFLLTPHGYKHQKDSFIISRTTGDWKNQLSLKQPMVDFFLKETEGLGAYFCLLKEFNDLTPSLVFDNRKSNSIEMMFKTSEGTIWAPLDINLNDEYDVAYYLKNNKPIYPNLRLVAKTKIYNLKCTGSVRTMKEVVWHIEYITETSEKVEKEVVLRRDSINKKFWMTHIQALVELDLIQDISK